MTDYTLTELQAMPNVDLSALAAELRGIRQIGTNPVRWADEQGEAVALIWRPTADRNQSGELLKWATEQGLNFACYIGGRREVIVDFRGNIQSKEFVAHVPGNTARAETVAFCAAMLAMKGRLK